MNKRIAIIIFIITSSVAAIGQTEINDIFFCSSKNQQLAKCDWGKFDFRFNGNPLQYLSTSDSSFFYDAIKKELTIKTNYPKSFVVIRIYKDTLEIKNKLTDSSFFFSNLISLEDYNPYIHFKEQVVQVHYANYKLIGLSFFFNCDYTINARLFTLKTSNIGWDVQISDRFNRSVKIYENSEGYVSNIYLCRDKSFTPSIKKPFQGTEIVTNWKKSKPIGINKIRLVKTTSFNGVFAYEDIIVYDKKGKLKSSKVDIKQCD